MSKVQEEPEQLQPGRELNTTVATLASIIYLLHKITRNPSSVTVATAAFTSCPEQIDSFG